MSQTDALSQITNVENVPADLLPILVTLIEQGVVSEVLALELPAMTMIDCGWMIKNPVIGRGTLCSVKNGNNYYFLKLVSPAPSESGGITIELRSSFAELHYFEAILAISPHLERLKKSRYKKWGIANVSWEQNGCVIEATMKKSYRLDDDFQAEYIVCAIKKLVEEMRIIFSTLGEIKTQIKVLARSAAGRIDSLSAPYDKPK